jgi:hypothetical protein
MSRKLVAALRASMEMDGDVEILNPLVSNAETNIDAALANTTSDVVEATVDVDDADDTVEVLDGAAEAMEALQTALESCIEEGGMTPQTARAHNIAMAQALKALPVDVDRVTVSSESFGGHGDKMSASLEALEGVKAVLKKVWEAIVSAVKSAFEMAARFFVTIRKSAPVIIAAGNALKTKATALKGKPVMEPKMDADSAAKSFHVGGAFSGDVAKALLAIENGGKGVVSAGTAAAGQLKAIAGKITSDGYDMAAEFTAFGQGQVKAVGDNALPGGKKIVLSANGIPTLSSDSEFSGKSEIATPTIADIEAIANNVIAIGRFVSEFDAKSFKTLSKSVDDFVKTVGASVAAVSGEDKEKATKLKASLAGVSKLALVARGCGPQYISYMASSAKLAVQFGNSALKNYAGAAKA